MQKRTSEITAMTELIAVIKKANKAYYDDDIEIMPNPEYDRLCDELEALEKATGIVLANSPSINMPQTTSTPLEKTSHETRMLSLNKTKDVQILIAWLGNQSGCLSWKLDGLTVVLTYNNGVLCRAVTRGNGEIGEIVTENARTFDGVPLRIPYTDHLVIRGEALISYETFERINRDIPDETARYKNPRNLASGSVRQLDPAVAKARNVEFVAFEMVTADNAPDSYAARLGLLAEWGFTVVEHITTTAPLLEHDINTFQNRIESNPLPSDGLVLTIDSVREAASLGTTSKYPLGTIAFKWQDEMAETTLRDIEWSPSRTGLINPVAVFNPVELDGTTVSRASLHNISIIRKLKLGRGDTIRVYKANMIIPQVYDNLTCSGNWELTMLPAFCPSCGRPTAVIETDDSKGPGIVATLHCPSPGCPAKHVKSFALMASRDALDIRGLSEATLEKLIAAGFIHEYADLFLLHMHRDAIAMMDGFGEASADNLIAAVENARTTSFRNVLYGLGIPGIGHSQSANITSVFRTPQELIRASVEDLSAIEGIGAVKAQAVYDWMNSNHNYDKLCGLLSQVRLQERMPSQSTDKLKGRTYVITGSLNGFANRDELKALIEANGGKVSGSVSAKTFALINNDNTSNSSKNKKAKELDVAIITEKEFMESLK